MSSPVVQPADAATIGALAARLPELMLRDQQRIGRRLDGTRRVRSPEARQKIADELAADIAKAELRMEQRRAAVPAISYPQELPVSQKKDDILAAIRDHQVVIVAGETGSGKTTQIPKICLELGRGVKGLIGHTQPAGSPPARSPTGSPRSWPPCSARPWAGRSASPTRSARTPWSS